MNAMKQVIAKLETELHEKSTNNSFLEAEIRTMQRKLQMKDAEINRQSTELHKLRVKLFENHRKSPIQHCERSELRSNFEWTKVHQKWSILASFLKCDILVTFWRLFGVFLSFVHSKCKRSSLRSQC